MSTIELTKTPSTLNLLLRAAATVNKPGKMKQETLPPISASMKNVKPSMQKINAYNKVCGFSAAGSMPITYPHILCYPLHMEMMISPEFPFPMLGLVHVKNEITQHRAIGNQELLNIHTELTGPEVVAKGYEFTLLSKITVGGALAWESKVTYLARAKTPVEDKKSGHQTETFEPAHQDFWDLPKDLGRRYAKVSGDSNPIHLYGLTAKLFGFPRAIAHGMWSKAYALAALEDSLPENALRVSVSFKLPMMLPNKVLFQYSQSGDHIEFRLKDKNGEKPHMAGSIDLL